MSILFVQGGVYGGSFAALSTAWYNGYTQSSFHFFDDANEWLQMDKAGHVVTSWYLVKTASGMYRWSGAGRKQSILYGTAGSFLYLTGIEMLDGFSEGWGFSWSDFSANILGAGIATGQEFLKEKKKNSLLFNGIASVSFKYSFHVSPYASLRPSLLGKNFAEQMLKDYNGQSYWISFNLSSFMNEETRFPGWLNLAFGYGGEGMISGDEGFVYVDESGNAVEFVRYRQYYFSLDADLSRIPVKSGFLKALSRTFCFIKIPSPALEFSGQKITVHPFYF